MARDQDIDQLTNDVFPSLDDPFAKPNKIAKKLGLEACADG